MSIYFVRLGRMECGGSLIINVGSFITADFEEAKEVASFFEKMNYFTEIYEEIKVKETDVRIDDMTV